MTTRDAHRRARVRRLGVRPALLLLGLDAGLSVAACAVTVGSKAPWTYEAPRGDTDTNARASVRMTPARGDGPSLSAETGREPEGDLESDGNAKAWQHAIFFQWPLPATGVNSTYGARVDPWSGGTRMHYGVDLEARYGAVVGASADGLVAYTGWRQGHGRHVVLEHGAGYRTVYSHLSSIIVSEGDIVRAGHAVGLVGNSGRSTGPHLHFELLRHARHLDPLDYLGSAAAIDSMD